MNRSLDYIPLHPAQSVVYMDYLFAKSREKFNIGGCVKFYRHLDYAALARANEAFLQANGSSRMIITERDGNILQRISQSRAVQDIEYLDFSGMNDPAAHAEHWIQARMDCPMDILDAPLVEQALIKIAADEHWYFLRQHHIAADAYSFSNRINRCLQLLAGNTPCPAMDDSDYVDEIEHSLSYLHGQDYHQDETYWREALDELRVSRGTPYLRGNTYSISDKSLAKASVIIDTPGQARIKAIASEQGLSEQIIINSVLLQQLSAWLGRDSLVVGFPSHNRVYKRQKKLYGMFATIVPVVMPVEAAKSLRDFSYLLKQEQNLSYLHRRYSWVDMVNNLMAGEEAIDSFFDVIISYQKIDLQFQQIFPDVVLKEYTSSRDDIPLRVIIRDYSADAMEISIEYQRGLFSSQDAARLVSSLTTGFAVFDQFFSSPLADYHRKTGSDSFREAFRYWHDFPHHYLAPIEVGSRGVAAAGESQWQYHRLAITHDLTKDEISSLWILFIAKLYDAQSLYVWHSSLREALDKPLVEQRLVSVVIDSALPAGDFIAVTARQLQQSLMEAPPVLRRALAEYASYPAVAHTFIADQSLLSEDGEMDLGELGLIYRAEKRVEIGFKPTQVSAAEVARLANCFFNIIATVSTTPSRRLMQVSLLSEGEIGALHQSIIANYHAGSYVDTIYNAFYTKALAYPEQLAVIHNDQRETYDSLSAKVNRVAAALLGLGLKKGDVLAIHLERGVDLIVCIIAAVKIGAIYLPLDEKSPLDRLRSILLDAEPRIMVTRSDLCTDLAITHASPSELYPQQEPASVVAGNEVAPEDAAYLLYTSGSTGKPKGVLQSHRNVLQLFATTQASFGFNRHDVWVLFHSIAFDFSVWELWGALLHGGTLVIPSYECTRDTRRFLALVAKQQVTVLNQTPSAFKLLMNELAGTSYSLEKLRYVIFGGEKLDPGHLAPWWALSSGKSAKLVNMFGITETTVHSTYKALDPQVQGHSNIGRFLADQRPYVFDSHLNMVPDNIVGELYIGGDRLAIEYFNNRALTDERFISNPYSSDPQDKLYKTGDLVKRLANGEFIYHSRKDFQISLRGFRIELGEIESALMKHPRINDAMVRLLKENDEKFLVAFYEVDDRSTVWNHDLYGFLKEKLPDYMIPERYIAVDAWPITINGKVDFKALERMAEAGLRPYAQAVSEVDWQAPAALVRHLLQGYVKGDITHSDLSLYNYGWNSMAAIRFAAEVRELLDVDIPIVTLLESPTLDKILTRLHSLLGDDKMNHIADEYFKLLEMTDEQLQLMCT